MQMPQAPGAAGARNAYIGIACALIGSRVGREIVRGVLASIFGGSRRR